MDIAYSPHRESCGTLHLPSPTHSHAYHMEGFSSIQQLRRSLSRSPSRPSRFQLRSNKTDSPGSPISPLALARAFSPRPFNKENNNAGPTSSFPASPLAPAAPQNKKKFSLRRTTPFRSSPRNRTNSKSPRHILSESSDQGNATPFVSRRLSGEENNPISTGRKPSTESLEKVGTEQKPSMRFDLDDKPIKFEFARSRPESNAPGANCLMPAKSSPLKRSDGIMNLDTASMGSPVAKRRSLHGASSFGPDFDIFDHAPAPRSSADDVYRTHDTEMGNGYSFSSPINKTNTPLRRTSSLRKSTLSQRHGSNVPRSKPAYDGDFLLPGQAASKTRQRMSLDGSLAFSSGTTQSPFRKSTNSELVRPPLVPMLRGGVGNHQPHPLSNALTPSSSSSNLGDDSPAHSHIAAPPTAAPRRHAFSRSLPIGSTRPHLQPESHAPDGSFETPMAYKMAKPNPTAFMSTGLLSKKNRNADEGAAGAFGVYVMPDTPSKRMSFPPVTATPTYSRSVFGKSTQQHHEFGTPSTPFSLHASKNSTESFGKGVSIFGSSNHLTRRGSFASIASVEGDENPSYSPSGNHMADSQSSADDMPPTPTKPHDSSSRRSKESSLRRKTFGRGRVSIDPDTFTPPTGPETPNIDIPGFTHGQNASPMGASGSSGRMSPHTPQESFCPPDPSKLSISGQNRRDSLPFNLSTNSNMSFPPATPTAPRDQTIFFGAGPSSVVPIAGLTKNDVDTALTSRFHSVTMCGNGEFSQVYRVEDPVDKPLGFRSPPANQVWAVKKTKKPYIGVHDREKKLREVEILQSLRDHEHVVSYTDHWEFKNHLYIQTEFCENGNLKDFLAQTGYKGRLDDFRIWKILLELSLGVKAIHDNGFIHLDLKPANVLIDWEGVLKIGDFGLASAWPAPPHIDGEGDRRYLGPEVLSGRFDKPADVYALGMIMCEIAANIVLPENGTSWQKLRSGDFTEIPSLTWSAESSLQRDANGDPIIDPESLNGSSETLCVSDAEDDPLKFLHIPSIPRHPDELVKPPTFMIDPEDNEAMDKIVQSMMNPNPDERPTIDQVYRSGGCQWVERRRRAGATVYEGNWGPADDVLGFTDHLDMDAADMMDTS
ncbi:hypothetical protein BCR34DRAFT_483636 [Clohesyomyces aquaticus]|uniref:Protein kinase domain-containing protein n=1 Tax=Clohesyomyces aquaticus TaxID=1231657 RepID=A0A1Y1ZNL4_9PLEO|nr:hypothetical protein BCR34DRAFT_483636 [Clohesyomyces aquaticus]